MKLSVVIPVHNVHNVTFGCLENLNAVSKTKPEVIVIDNGSEEPFVAPDLYPSIRVRVVRNPNNTGVWPTFRQGLESTDAEIIAFIHNDLYIYEEGWDKRLIDAFKQDAQLALVGFIGSNEQDRDGGRGL